MAYRRFIFPDLCDATVATDATVRIEGVETVASVAIVAGVADAQTDQHPVSPVEWDEQDWHSYFEERAAIAEFDGGYSQPQAEMRAYECCIAEWSWRNFECSPPDCCAQCGRQPGDFDPLVPIGAESIGHVWLHDGCWSDWRLTQRRRATSSLEALGIKHPIF